MRKKYKTILISFCMLLILMLSACKSIQESPSGDLKIYCMKLDMSSMEVSYCDSDSLDGENEIEKYLNALKSNPKEDDLRSTIPDSISVLGYEQKDFMLILNFSKEYYELLPTEEVLVRAAIVRTITQVEGISYVTFQVEGESLLNSRGDKVGAMNSESFVENPDEAINSTQEVTLTLYFSSSDGTYLVAEKRYVHYSSNETLEKLIVEKLMEGPKTQGLLATIPAGTNLITVSLDEGGCYVNLDAGFLNQNQAITEGTVLYSLVNSLTELDSVDRVQLSVNGDTSGKCRYTYDLSTMYERDESFFTPPDELSSEVKEEDTE